MKRKTATATTATTKAPLSREQTCALVATAMCGATIASTVLITADATSVYDGASLPQVLLILLTGVVASFGGITFWPRWRSARRSVVLLLLLVGWLLVSTLSATWLANGRAAWNGFWHVLAVILFGLIAGELCRHRGVARAAFQLLIAVAIAQSVHGLHQVIVSMPQTRAAYEQNPDQMLAEMNIDAPPGSALRAQYESRLYSSEPLATFALTNSLAVLLSGALVALGIWLAAQLRKHAAQRLTLTAAGVAWVMIGSAWLLTKSRTAYLSVVLVAVACAAVAWWQRRAVPRVEDAVNQDESSPRKWWVIATVSIVGLFTALVILLARDSLILSEAPLSLSYRLEYWQATSKMILQHPLTGVGLGNFQSYYPQYKLPAASEIVADPHNWLFDIAATCSLPVLCLVLIAAVSAIARIVNNLVQLKSSDEVQPLAIGRPALRHSSSDVDQARAALEDRMVQALWIGAALGWGITASMQWLVREGIDIEASSIGLVLSVCAVLLLRIGSQPSERVWRGAALVAALTMMTCLLASGSWQASGLALPFVLWLAISLAPAATEIVNTPPTASTFHKSATAAVPQRGAVVGHVISIALLLGFLLQTWRPVNMSWTHEQSALAAMGRGDFESARASAAASIAADPIDPGPQRLMVHVLTSEAVVQSSADLDSASERVQLALDSLLDCDPAAEQNWTLATQTLMTLAATAEEKASAPAQAAATSTQTGLAPLAERLLQQAETFSKSAIERYPSSVAAHAQRAVILALLHQTAESRVEVDEAYALSEASPHLDRKLAMQQVWLPQALAKFPDAAIVRPSRTSTWVQAEPLCEFLRKN